MKIEFPGLLFIVLLILKCTGAIAWSWWWVTCPIWGGIVIIIAFAILAAISAACAKKL